MKRVKHLILLHYRIIYILYRRELESSGIMNEDKKYKFTFNSFDKEYESFKGKLA